MSELLLDVGQMRDPEARIERTFAAGVLPTDQSICRITAPVALSVVVRKDRMQFRLAGRLNGAYIHPFDDPSVWAGHATMIHEAAEEVSMPGAVVVSVGGGGLLCGVVQGMKEVGWSHVPVLAVETRGADSFAKAVAAGRLVTLDAITSIATTLGARTVAPEALAWAGRREIVPWVVTDRSAVQACVRFADDHRVLVEPACGASLSAVYDRADPLRNRRSVLVIVCGGAGVTRESLTSWEEQTR